MWSMILALVSKNNCSPQMGWRCGHEVMANATSQLIRQDIGLQAQGGNKPNQHEKIWSCCSLV